MNTHGGNIYKNKTVLDFSANISPFENSFIKDAVIASADMWSCYPDPDCTELVQRISGYEGEAPKKIVCGNGAADLIYRIVHTLKPEKALLLSPTFTEYEKALKEANCLICKYHLREETGFMPEDDLLDFIEQDTDIVFICDPNNPTGRVFPRDLKAKLTEKCTANNTTLVCDECFMDFVLPEKRTAVKNIMTESCICLKAFTKIFAIPGLRLGYALFGNEHTAAAVRENGQCWSVSVPAQAAGIAAADHAYMINDTASEIALLREEMQHCLDDLEITYFPSDANFILFRAEAGLDERLLKHGIMIRCCRDTLSEKHYRIAVRTHEENMRLIRALKECIHG